jgi:DNA-binding transcriptional LysR family regulator
MAAPTNPQDIKLNTQLAADLFVFAETVKAGGIGAAGRRLGLSQGAISQRIARLEERLGYMLFVRGTKGLSLTPQGVRLSGAAQQAHDGLAAALTELRAGSNFILRINCTPSLASDWLAPSLNDFYAEHPQFSLVIHADQTPLSAERMRSEGVDIGIRYAGAPLAGCVELGCVAEQIVPVCAPQYLEDDRAIVRLHDETPWADAEPQAEWRDWEKAGHSLKRRVARDQMFNLASLAYEAASAGHGVAMGRLCLVRNKLKARTLICAGQPVVSTASYRIFSPAKPRERNATTLFVNWAMHRLSTTRDSSLVDVANSANAYGPIRIDA